MESSPSKLARVSNIATTVCLWHCMLLPLIIGVLPSLGLAVLFHGAVEWTLLSIAVFFGILSLCWGYRSHRKLRAFSLLFVAVVWFSIGAALHNHFLSIGGAVFMFGANILNSYLCKTCTHCCAHKKNDSKEL